jgi:ribosomal protein S12 methylthiotransferase accessory factor
VEYDPETQLPRHVKLEVQLPAGFPDKYRSAILHAAERCKVKQTIAAQPSFEISAEVTPAP